MTLGPRPVGEATTWRLSGFYRLTDVRGLGFVPMLCVEVCDEDFDAYCY